MAIFVAIFFAVIFENIINFVQVILVSVIRLCELILITPQIASKNRQCKQAFRGFCIAVENLKVKTCCAMLCLDQSGNNDLMHCDWFKGCCQFQAARLCTFLFHNNVKSTLCTLSFPFFTFSFHISFPFFFPFSFFPVWFSITFNCLYIFCRSQTQKFECILQLLCIIPYTQARPECTTIIHIYNMQLTFIIKAIYSVDTCTFVVSS